MNPQAIHFVYVLRSQADGSFYVGSSQDHRRRLRDHNQGKVASTRGARPWSPVHLEAYSCRSRALQREKYLKSGWGRKWLRAQGLVP